MLKNYRFWCIFQAFYVSSQRILIIYIEILPRMVMVRPPGAMGFTFFLSCIYFWSFCRCLICLMSSAMESLSLENSFNLWVSSIQMLQLKKKSTVRLIFPSTVMHVGVPAPAHPHTHKHPVSSACQFGFC